MKVIILNKGLISVLAGAFLMFCHLSVVNDGISEPEAFTKKAKKKKKMNKSLPKLRCFCFPDLIWLGFLHVWIIYIFFKNDFIMLIFYSLIGVYIISVLVFSRFSFYEDHIEIRFPTRFWSKGKKIYYDDIFVLKKISFRYAIGFIIKLKKNKLKPEIGWPSNSFPCDRRKKRERLIEFLKSKNVEVEIA